MTAEKKPKSGTETVADGDVKKAARKASADKPAAAKKATSAKKPAAAKKSAVAKKPAAKKPVAEKAEAAPEAPKPKPEPIEEQLAALAQPAAKKATAKKVSTAKLRITQVRSQITFARSQRKVLAGLGLGRIGKSVIRHDDPCIRGMVAKVAHLVRVEEVEA